MSNPLAIAAVTATLQNLFTKEIHKDNALSDAIITVQSPDRARGSNTANQLNIFLYQVAYDAAFRNAVMPGRLRPGETGYPPLSLSLFYLITAYGQDNDDTNSHHLLSKAMSILHDHPLLGADEIRDSLPGNDLYKQLERVRITPQPITLDEMSKLWMTFQTQYRISAAYHISVVLIDSTRAVTTPLPVINRGDEDQGADVLSAPSAIIESIELPGIKRSAELGDVITLKGQRFDDQMKLYILNQHMHGPEDEPMREVILEQEPGSTAKEIKVKIPDDSTNWSAGLYTIHAALSLKGDRKLTTNELPLSLAPTILNIQPPSAKKGDVTLTLTVKPDVRPKQEVYLLFGSDQIALKSNPASDELVFSFNTAKTGDHIVRLRIDGVDSIPIDPKATPPKFDDKQKVNIHD